MDEKYEDFCRAKRCITYYFLKGLQLADQTDKVTKQAQIFQNHCKTKCEYTAQDFMGWLEKQSIKSLPL